jgi:hypothetical protein
MPFVNYTSSLQERARNQELQTHMEPDETNASDKQKIVY